MDIQNALKQGILTHNLPAYLNDVTEISLSDPMAFSCRGCGQNCCITRSDILLSAPHIIRIKLALKKRKTGNAKKSPIMLDHFPKHNPFNYYLGQNSKFPWATIKHIISEEDLHYCPFMEILSVGNEMMGKCGIYDARPNTCRTFPVARASVTEVGGTTRADYTYILPKCNTTCPGWKQAASGELVHQSYIFDPDQTVGAYLEKQIDRNQDMEDDIWFNQILTKGLKVIEHGKGSMPQLLGYLLYSDHPELGPNAQEAEIHETILSWLKMIEDELDSLLFIKQTIEKTMEKESLLVPQPENSPLKLNPAEM